MRRPFVLEARVHVPVSVNQARQWFLDLEAHPERYVMDTHAGFAFTQGSFGQSGSRFMTWERFYGFKLALHFELQQIEQQRFFFIVRRPPLPIWGAFVIEREGREPDSSSLALQIGGTALVGEWILKCPPLRKAIGRQIGSEVRHIRDSMEALNVRDRD